MDVFKPLSDIIPQESRYQIEEESKEEVKEEINQDRPDESLADAQLIKLSKEDKAKRYNKVETLLSMGYSVQQIAEDAQVNMSSSTVKRLKAKVRVNKSIIREEGSGRPKTLLVIHQDFILKLLNDSPFNTCKRITLKLKNKNGIEVDKTAISRFLVDKGFKWKGPQIVFRNNEQDQQNRLEFCLRIKIETRKMYLSQMKYHSIYDLLVKIDGLQQVILIKEQRQSIQIKFMHGKYLVLKELLNFNFLQEIWIVSSISNVVDSKFWNLKITSKWINHVVRQWFKT